MSGALLMIAAHEVGQGQAVHHAGDGGLNVPPHLYGDAPVGPVAAAGIVLIHTAHRRQIALQHPQNLPHGVLLWLTGEEVAAPRAPDRANQPGPGELSYNLLQIFIGNLLPLGHIPQRNCRAMAVKPACLTDG